MPRDDDYSRLRNAHDQRWTNLAKRTAVKTAAEVGTKMAELRRKGGLRLAEAEQQRLVELKQTMAALTRLKDGVNRQAGIVTGLPVTSVHDGARYKAFEDMPAEDIDDMLLSQLSRNRQKVMEVKNRVKEKTLRLTQIKSAVLEQRGWIARATDARFRSQQVVAMDGSGDWSAGIDKKVEAVQLINREIEAICDLTTNNLIMMDALNDQLRNDVRQQAAVVVKLLTCGNSAQEDVAEFNRKYIRSKLVNLRSTDKTAFQKKKNNARSAKLELNRNLLIDEQDRSLEADVRNTFDLNLTYSYLEGTGQDEKDKHLEMVTTLIETGEIERQMNPPEPQLESWKSDDLSQQSSESSIALLSTSFTYPEHKVDRFRPDGNHLTREMAAAEYVRDALGFINTADVLEYIRGVKNIELRIKNLVNEGKMCTKLAQERLAYMTDLEMERVKCVPMSLLRLDENLKYLKNTGLEPQKTKIQEIKLKVNDYFMLFNQLFFLLDHLTSKLDRCQLPVVRRYRLQNVKQLSHGCTDNILEVHELLNTLDMQQSAKQIDEDAGLSCNLKHKTFKETKTKLFDSGTSDRPVVKACWDSLSTLETKLQACMLMMRDADPTEKEQLEARAWFEYNMQKYLGKSASKFVKVSPSKRPSSAEEIRDTGILTRAQAKRQAEDIYKYFTAPKDTDDMKRSRKPISFRKAFVVV